MTITKPWDAIYTGNLILVNQQYPYQANLARQPITGVELPNSQVMVDSKAALLLNELMKRIGGWEKILPVSGWRSQKEQEDIFTDSLTENGLEFTNKYVAKPGCSEHQTGLAIDLAVQKNPVDFIRPSFPYSGICQKFREAAPLFGFMERYPLGKEEITGIAHEPWHFRYVSAPHAEIMQNYKITLEEYHGFLKRFPSDKRKLYYSFGKSNVEVSYIPANPEGVTQIDLEEEKPYSISGNNIDGFILTQWGC